MINVILITSIFIIGIIIALIIAYKRGGILPLFIVIGSGIVTIIALILLVGGFK